MARTILPLAAGLMLLLGATAQAQEGGRPFTIQLTGAAEVHPGGGDPDGAGTATVRLNPGLNQVCYELSVTNIGTAVGAHIHRGSVTVSGPIVVDFAAPTNGTSEGCATPRAGTTVQDIMRDLDNYYVNVHSQAIPAGAIRGQMAKPGNGPKTVKNPF